MAAVAILDAMERIGIDTAILDRLMPDLVGHDRHPSAFLVYLFLWRRTHGIGATEVCVSLSEITDGTGLSKRSVQSALGRLVKRRLLGSRERRSHPSRSIPCTVRGARVERDRRIPHASDSDQPCCHWASRG